MQVFTLSPDTGKVSAKLTKGASVGRNGRTILSCVRKHAPFASQGSALPGQRRSVSLCFRVATLLKTQFACLRVRGKLTTKEERNYSFYYFIYAFDDILCRILRSRSYFIRMFRSFTHAYRRSRMTAEVNCVF